MPEQPYTLEAPEFPKPDPSLAGMKPSDSFVPAGWYDDPRDVSELRWWNGVEWCAETKNKLVCSNQESLRKSFSCNEQNEGISDFRAIKNWKTSVGFSVLGLFAGFVLAGLVNLLISFVLSISMGSYAAYYYSNPIQGMVLAALMAIYAFSIYPSYYRRAPKVKSSKAISFLNMMFGSLIFGCLWNANLTKSNREAVPHIGISYYVAFLLGLLQILIWAIDLFLLIAALH